MALLPQFQYRDLAGDGMDAWNTGYKQALALKELQTQNAIGAIMARSLGGGGSNGLAGPAAPAGNSLADRIIGVESGGNATARNPNSSAAGAGQFIKSTWLDMIKRQRPDLAAGKSDADLLAMRDDPALSREMTQAYADQNALALRRAGFEPTPGNTYLAHFAGPAGATAVLRADPSTQIERVLSRDAIAANAFLRGKTAGDLRNWADQKMGGAPVRVAQAGPDFRGAAAAAYQGGNVAMGNQLINMQEDAESRANVRTRQATQDQREADERKQQLAAKAQIALSNVASAIETPEQFEMAKGMLAQAGYDVSGYTFDQLPLLKAQALDAKTRAELAIKQQLADAKTAKGTSADSMSPELRKAVATQDAKSLKEFSDASEAAVEIQDSVNALKVARDRTNFEGSWFDNGLFRTIGRNIGGGLGVVPTSQDVQALDEMNAQAGNLTLSATSKLKGVLSDSDMALLRSTVPNSDLTDAAAENVIFVMEAGAQRAQDKAAMFDAWIQQNGSGRGFQEAWSRYARENPLFTKDKSGQVVRNTAAGDWTGYLTPQQRQSNAPAKPEGKSDADLINEARQAVANGADREAVRARLQQWGLSLGPVRGN